VEPATQEVQTLFTDALHADDA